MIFRNLESYYQENRTCRSGRRRRLLRGILLKDIEKLENFLPRNLVSEREIGLQLLNEVVGYAETSMSRRQYLLYYGEEFDPVNGDGAKWTTIP